MRTTKAMTLRMELTITLQDVPYLSPILAQVEAELAEKDALDSMVVIKNH